MVNKDGTLIVEIGHERIVKGRSGVNTNGAFTIPDKQKAYMHQGALHPLPFEIAIPDDRGPYPPGLYVFGFQCFKAGKYGPEFDDRNARLTPIEQAIEDAKKATAPNAEKAKA